MLSRADQTTSDAGAIGLMLTTVQSAKLGSTNLSRCEVRASDISGFWKPWGSFEDRTA